MKYTIYKTTNLINNKFYIGKHQTENVNDSYYGSGKALKCAISKYGKENFKKEILFIFDNEEDMNKKEIELITEEFVKRNDTYNVGVGGEGGSHFKGKKHSEETIKKIKESIKKVDFSNRKGIPAHNKGLKDSAETKKKKSEAAKIRFKNGLDENTKKKISNTLKNKKIIKDGKTINEISEKMKGNKNSKNHKSEEYRKKQSEIMKNYWKKKKEEKENRL
jgi:hypothetical protein